MKEETKQRNKFNLVFIINGVDVIVEANVHEPLKAARNRALEQSNNTGRQVDEWEIRNEDGEVLSYDSKIGDLGLAEGARIFLNLKVGAGGAE